MDKKAVRNGFMDLMKFLMAICIMWGHYSYIMAEEYTSVEITQKPLQTAHHSVTFVVCIFFVISGFYAYGSFCRLHSEGVQGMVPFLKKKVNRLYPLMLCSILYFCIADLLFLFWNGHFWAGRTVSLSQVILAVLGISRWVSDKNDINGPMWYVSVLILCYVLLCLISVSKIKKEYKYLLFCLLIVLGLGAQFHKEITFPLLADKVGRGYMCFFAGILIAAVFEKHPAIRKLRNVLLTLALLLLFLMIGRAAKKNLMGSRNIVAAFCGTPMLIAFGQQSFAGKLFNHSLFSYLGNISYAMFLLHVPTYVMTSLLFGSSIDYNSWPVIGCITLVVILISALLTKLTKKARLL